MKLRHIAEREGKLLSFLRRELGLSSSLVKRLKWQNAFLVNGIPVHTDHPVHMGDEIVVRLDEAQPDFPAEDGPVEILYEDEALLALDKPAGLLMHPSFYRMTGTLANYVAGYYRRTGQACAVHPVSRLDRDTFGVVLLAKNAHIHAEMMQQLQQQQVKKIYEALVVGHPVEACGIWQAPIARRGGGSLLREVRPDGQSAVTRYQVLCDYGAVARLQLEPVTGRTHQLRVHCADAGCPILGDWQYAPEQELAVQMGLTHQQLCAVQLSFDHPLTGQRIAMQSRQQLVEIP